MLKSEYPELAKQWNESRNTADNLSFEDISHGAKKVVWWKCEKGHEWQASPNSRTNKNCGCPYCSNQRVLAGYNDLATTDSAIAMQWDFEKNIDLSPKDFTRGSNTKVWWKCEKGHEWQASPCARSRGEGCPYCSNKKVLVGYNDLATTDPEIAKQWDYEKNGDLTPKDFVRGSAKMVWWRCEKGHEWQARLFWRTKMGNGCPYCCNQKILTGYNDLATIAPELVQEWDFDKNDKTPYEVAPSTTKKFWWKCEKGHSYYAAIVEKRKGKGCPYCSGRKVLVGYNDLTTINPNLASEWNYDRNGNLKPTEVTGVSGKNVWWKCKKGHEWQATIASRAYGNGCPKCASENQTSLPEKIVYYYISKAFDDVLENYKPSWLKPMELDIFIPSINVAIEYDGRRFHKNSEKDNRKNSLCKEHGVKLFRLREEGCSEINNLSNNFTLRNIKSDGSQVVDGIKWLMSELGFNLDINLSRDSGEINNTIDFYEKQKSLTDERLIREWNYEKNGNLKPEHVTTNSGRKVWWRCEKGHEWQAIVNDRCRGDSCPYCSGHRVLKGFNDIFTTNPELKKLWDFDKNIAIDPYSLSKGSSAKVWWRCEKGHSFQATVNSKTQGVKCPVCNGKQILKGFNDLETLKPSIAKEWNYAKNNNLKPSEVAPFSNKKVWWKCEKGHEWQTYVSTRSSGNGCPICGNKQLLKGYNDLATVFPDIALDWDYEMNDDLPGDVLPSSKDMHYWKCHKCGFSYEKSVYNKVRSPKCPRYSSQKDIHI